MNKKGFWGVLSALACALVLVLSSVAPALAATTTGSITVKSDDQSSSDVYQLITTEWTDGSTNGPTYKWDSSVLAWLKTQNGMNNTPDYSAYYNADGTVSDKFTSDVIADTGNKLTGAFDAQSVPDLTDSNNKAALFFGAVRAAIADSSITGLNKVNTKELKNGDKVEGLTYGSYLIITTSTPDASVTNPLVYLPTVVTIGPVKGTDGNWSIANANKNLNPDVTIKATKPTLTKTEQVENKDANKKDDTVAVGDTVTFTLIATVPAYADGVTPKTFKITDTMSKGLAYTNWNDVTIKSGNDDIKTSFKQVDSATELTGKDEGKTQIVFEPSDYSTIQKYQNSTITITYKAKVTADALVDTSLVNDAKLEYNNGYVTDKTDLFTYGLDVLKYEKKDDANDKSTVLGGVVFNLYKGESATGSALTFKNDVLSTDADASVALTTDNQGKLHLSGLDAGKYTLKEVTPKAGYQTIGDITFEIKAATGSDGKLTGKVDQGSKTTGYWSLDVPNTKGFSLPQTGGTGTLLLTAAGVVLLGGAALLILRKGRQ